MQFEVRALRGAKGVVRLALDAPDEANAVALARAQGLTVLSVSPKRSLARRALTSRFPLLLFGQELLALLAAGLSLVEVLDTMVEKEHKAEVKKLLLTLREKLFEGRSFSQALEGFPAVFPALFVATVRASERTGDLPEALRRFIDYQDHLDKVKKKVISASIYPAVLILVGGLVTLFLLVYVVPRFAGIYADSGRDLPMLSRALIEWGRLLNEHGTLIAGISVTGLAVVAALLLRGHVVAAWVMKRVPALGERARVYQLARFYRTVGMLLRGGTPLVTALQMVGGLLPSGLNSRLLTATQRIREGTSISVAMESAGLVTSVALRMLRVGERSGDMPLMMERIAIFHDEELARWIDWFTKLFEPLLMALIGIVIGAIVVLMYLPIFELAGSLQ